jgi:tetratricopeptide (TPR) repeat protein
MSRMLSLVFHAWNLARQAAQDGRFAEASRNLDRVLADDGALPLSERVQAHRLAGSLHLEAQRFSEARREFRAAIVLKPSVANTHYLLGLAHARDCYGNREIAARRFRKATQLDAENATYWAALGQTALRIGRTQIAKRALLRAAKLAPTDADVLTTVVDSLLEAGWVRTALRLATQARFLAPKDRNIVALWNRVKFERAASEQRQARSCKQPTSKQVLPFVRLVTCNGKKRIIHRADDSSSGPLRIV